MTAERFLLNESDRERAVERALSFVDDTFGDEVRPTHACLYVACSLQMILARFYGVTTMLQAGTCQWPMILAEEDDGECATHFSYQWEPTSVATAVNLAQNNLPELHVWLGYRDEAHPKGIVIDATTGTWRARALEAGYEWTALEPPRFLWADPEELARLMHERGDLGITYAASLDACWVADAFAKHGIYPRVAKALGL